MTRVRAILLALTLDLTLGDPPNRFHPLLLMGKWLHWGQRLAPSRSRFWFGTAWILSGLLLFTLPWRKAILPSSFIVQAFLLKPIFAYRNLRRAVQQVAQALALDNLVQARRLLGWHLVSRDTQGLNAAEVAGAAIESLAENLTDSLTAPLLVYAAAGLPAAWAYRFVNTADAMWGYRTAEFEQLGKFPARLDDLLNWLPARLSAWLLVAAAYLVGENGRQARQTMLAQHHRTPSPNAGWTMSAMAGALTITLDKRGVYQLEGGTSSINVNTIRRALRLADVCAGLVVLAAGFIALFSTKFWLEPEKD
jgi:adenosylcobinamide-phosphate synthase